MALQQDLFTHQLGLYYTILCGPGPREYCGSSVLRIMAAGADHRAAAALCQLARLDCRAIPGACVGHDAGDGVPAFRNLARGAIIGAVVRSTCGKVRRDR